MGFFYFVYIFTVILSVKSAGRRVGFYPPPLRDACSAASARRASTAPQASHSGGNTGVICYFVPGLSFAATLLTSPYPGYTVSGWRVTVAHPPDIAPAPVWDGTFPPIPYLPGFPRQKGISGCQGLTFQAPCISESCQLPLSRMGKAGRSYAAGLSRHNNALNAPA